ncbi:MAG: hypothetical protein GF334_11165 [Candidatus Altiarchaeales archaeon]|nr:hypothetical protein [Candidatus Altiarchaeales archaeon]
MSKFLFFLLVLTPFLPSCIDKSPPKEGERCSVGLFKRIDPGGEYEFCLVDFYGIKNDPVKDNVIDCFYSKEELEEACEVVRNSERCE